MKCDPPQAFPSGEQGLTDAGDNGRACEGGGGYRNERTARAGGVMERKGKPQVKTPSPIDLIHRTISATFERALGLMG